MDWSLADRGVDLDGIYYCPHHPDAIIEEYKKECDCRKPATGMFMDAKAQLNIDMASSYMVGDKKEDMLAAKAAGVGHKILVRTGKAITEEAETCADFVLDSLADLPKWLKSHKK